jgi:hydrogenase expression/formation protein HypC
MCLGEIVRLDTVRGDSGTARLGGRTLTVSLVTLEQAVSEGDWVVVHSGFALQRLDPDEAAEALSLRTGEPSQPATHHPTTDPQEDT